MKNTAKTIALSSMFILCHNSLSAGEKRPDCVVVSERLLGFGSGQLSESVEWYKRLPPPRALKPLLADKTALLGWLCKRADEQNVGLKMHYVAGKLYLTFISSDELYHYECEVCVDFGSTRREAEVGYRVRRALLRDIYGSTPKFEPPIKTDPPPNDEVEALKDLKRAP